MITDHNFTCLGSPNCFKYICQNVRDLVFAEIYLLYPLMVLSFEVFFFIHLCAKATILTYEEDACHTTPIEGKTRVLLVEGIYEVMAQIN